MNGFLFSEKATPDLSGCQIANHYLLAAIRWLAFVEADGVRRAVDYKNLGSEELGSVYESLLELHPEFSIDSGRFRLATAGGHERKTSGAYYTPSSLVQCVLDSALGPVLNEACAQPNPEKAILALKVCDPACGSGHFLIAAAHRIAKKLASARTGIEEPGPEECRTALRDVIHQCIYGVDINPMAVELCKVNLWMEAVEPGKPLLYLDAHIQCGNSLIGATPALLKNGIPDAAFEPIEGDDKKICSEFKKLNKQMREGNRSLFREDQPDHMWESQEIWKDIMVQFGGMSSNTSGDIHNQENLRVNMVEAELYQNAWLLANAWCAAFVWKKTSEMRPSITHEEFRDIYEHPHILPSWRKAEIERLAEQYQFFHWYLAFPGVFRVPPRDEQPENEKAGWSGGFDVVLGNPPWEHTELKEQEWFASRDIEIAEAAGAERKWKIDALATKKPELYCDFLEARRQENGWSHFVRDTGHYPLCGHGRINTYAVFAELNRRLMHSKGGAGCIVPSGIATDDTTKFFFRDLSATHTLVSLYSFENEESDLFYCSPFHKILPAYNCWIWKTQKPG